MQATAVRDLHDWVTRSASLKDIVRASLDAPPPGRSRDARLSSATLGWRDLGFAQHEVAGPATLLPRKPGNHVLVLGLGRGRLVIEGESGRIEQDMQPGSVLVFPAGGMALWSAPASAQASAPLRCCVIEFAPALLVRTAAATYQAAQEDFTLAPIAHDYDFGVIGLAGALSEEAMRGVRGNNLYVNSLASTLAVHLLRHYAAWSRGGPVDEHRSAFERTLAAPEPVRRAVVYIRDNHTRDIGLQQIVGAADTNAFQLTRDFEDRLGAPPFQYLLQMRMQSAHSLLAAGAEDLQEVAQAVGFGDPGALGAREVRGARREARGA
jgi:AraC family transcriptional regulator